jgi:hypothetical protein
MKYKKVQTRVRTDGTVSTLALGWVWPEHLDRDMAEERDKFSRLALAAQQRGRTDRNIQAVETAGETLVAVYESGEVKIINYIEEKS